MKNKRMFLFLGIILLSIIVLGSMLTQNVKEVNGEEYDTAFYVEGSKNIFIMLAKTLDKCCYYIVDVVVSGVGSIFNSFLNN